MQDHHPFLLAFFGWLAGTALAGSGTSSEHFSEPLIESGC
jgi:hypothetical protein